jgi:carboxypeptidase C (cathepsin A)
MITYSVSRLEAKMAVENSDTHSSGNICEIVIGLSASSGTHVAYVDGVTGCLDMPLSDYSGCINSIVNDFILSNGWKKSLRAQISTRLNSPVAANIATPIIILD